MLDAMRRQWQQLREAEPGERFQQLHRRRNEAGSSGGQRGLRMAAAIAVILLGLVMMPAPGPGLLVVLAGLSLLASESLGTAQRLDRIERWCRERWRRGRA